MAPLFVKPFSISFINTYDGGKMSNKIVLVNSLFKHNLPNPKPPLIYAELKVSPLFNVYLPPPANAPMKLPYSCHLHPSAAEQISKG